MFKGKKIVTYVLGEQKQAFLKSETAAADLTLVLSNRYNMNENTHFVSQSDMREIHKVHSLTWLRSTKSVHKLEGCFSSYNTTRFHVNVSTPPTQNLKRQTASKK